MVPIRLQVFLALAVNTLNGIILNDEGLILGANVLSVSLMTDNGSKPGIALETFNFSGQMEQAGVIQALLTGSSILHPVLDNGVRYWLLASGGDSTARAIWDFNNQGANGLHSELNNEGWHTTLSNAVDTEEPNKVTYQGAFRVDGDLISTAAVPEPATVSLLGFGLLGLVFRRKKTN